MSTVRANTYQDASGGSNAVFSGVASPPNSMGFRNRIINGDMRIDQRNAGASVTPTADSYVIDRFSAGMTQASKMTFQQSSVAPSGFNNSLSVTVASAPTVGAGDWFGFFQKIEGFNTADLGFGTAGASTVTLSFWVRSSVTGTYGGSLMNAAQNRSYPYTYTVNAANTWEYKTITVAGDTTGTWVGATNGTGLLLIWSLGAGSNFLGTANVWGTTNALGTSGQQNWVTNAGATFYITGVQLEAGTVASPFERRDYGRELIMCQRYYWQISAGTSPYFAGKQHGTTEWYGTIQAPVPMRGTPTLTLGAGTSYIFGHAGVKTSTSTSMTVLSISNNNTYMALSLGGFSALTDNHVGNFRFDSTLQFSAEL